ncbi:MULTISPECIES: hypothetical protein [Brachybacterium]|uniref:hypothetical protein n=1 Tax=Brachybacterium TaxID=43668 RepID=UPI003FB90522
MTNPNFAPAAPTGGAPVKKTKWIVQLIVSILCGGNIITLVLAIVGLVKADTDLPLANKLYKWGWIVFAIIWILYIILIVIVIATGGLSASVNTY